MLIVGTIEAVFHVQVLLRVDFQQIRKICLTMSASIEF